MVSTVDADANRKPKTYLHSNSRFIEEVKNRRNEGEPPKWRLQELAGMPACGPRPSETLIRKHKHYWLDWCLRFRISVSLSARSAARQPVIDPGCWGSSEPSSDLRAFGSSTSPSVRAARR